MRKTIRTSILMVTALLLGLSGCALIDPPAATSEQIEEELAEIQGLIPVLEAGLSVAEAREVSITEATASRRAAIRTINAGDVFDSSETPSDVFAGGTEDESGWVRYPYDGSRIESFYGTEGNEAEFYLKSYSTDPAIYQVKLYIYPILSTTVNYVLEEYLVAAGDTGWAQVDEGGHPAPLYYLTNRTVYFDGSVAEREVVASTAAGGDAYDTLFDSESTDYTDATSTLYDFPSADPAEQDPAAYTGEDVVYSAKVIDTIADTGTTVVEYYTEKSDGSGGIIKSAVSYVIKEYVSGRFKQSARTVRRYVELADGTKYVRARTESKASFSRFATNSRTITESVDIDPNGGGSGITTLTSTTTSTDDNGDMIYSTTVELTETAADSGSFSGTSTRTTASGIDEYSVNLDGSVSGGMMEVGGTRTSVNYPVSRREAKDLIAELKRGGEFTGRLRGQLLSGVYKAINSGDSASIEASLGFIYSISGDSLRLR